MHSQGARLYSHALSSLLQSCKQRLFKILQKEVGAKTGSSRFLYKNISYPLVLVVFEDPHKLGYFDYSFFEIGINKVLLFTKDETFLDNLLRHELAHYLLYIEKGVIDRAHGADFHALCRRFGWDEEVYSAKAEISSNELHVESMESAHRILEKVQKLLALGTSSNKHEAESATLKANELLLTSGLKFAKQTQHSEEEMVAVRLLFAKKVHPKLYAIADILRTFLVHPIISRSQEGVFLELFGSKSSVLIAEYVAHFLDRELEEMVLMAKKTGAIGSSLTARNSFFRGVALGYVEKAKKMKNDQPQSVKMEIISLENVLLDTLSLAYPHLRKTAARYRVDKGAESLGKEKGSSLHIRPGVDGNVKNSRLSLLFK